MKKNQLVDPNMLLLQNRYAPTTNEIGFLKADMHQIVDAYQEWQENIPREHKAVFAIKTVKESLEAILSRLRPILRPVRDQCAFIPTSSQWVAYFDNGSLGTDADSVILHLSRKIGCLGVKLVASPHTIAMERKETTGSYGALSLYYTDPSQEKEMGYTRIIHLSNDGGPWVFINFGTPFSFETTDNYAVKNKLDRFTFAQLKKYLQELGIEGFEEKHYQPLTKGATIVERFDSSHNLFTKFFASSIGSL